MQIALFRWRDLTVSARGARGGRHPRRDGGEDRLRARERVAIPADHQAVATFPTPHTAAGATVE
ncbi:Uncharacterised protein [Mycobacterium tuberculosis]|uniref:Uncharacterized protein n=1 Tax=Mycobacterium tuberculosis TaxID=1773 RepID=A0A0U0RKG2_MYCTX|nr:Uncharacterised protein [Mycobacterium tuberculosis]COW11012.1 Uncharacterised protein [Mycobacterium tuberculosis]